MWEIYYDKHRTRPVRPLLQRAVFLCEQRDSALDLGAGTLNETAFLLGSGFKRVVAVDSAPEVAGFASEMNNPRLEVVISMFQELVLEPRSYDLITAQYALPFHGTEGFDAFFARLVSALKPGGVIAAQLFGERDGWNIPGDDRAFHTKAKAEGLLAGLAVREFEEVEKDGITASGEEKHWHVFHFIAVK